MTWRFLVVLLLVGAVVVPAPATAAGGGVVLTFRDRHVTESSGLVDLGPVMVTANDSGNPSKLYVVSARTGRTLGVTDFHAATVDVEALAPAGGSSVWVGDIGDNRRVRRSVSVYRVPVRRGDRDVHPARYRLAYPRGARDSESLFTDRQGRMHLVTKSFAGGTVYRAPRHLSRTRPNRLVPVGHVQELATDAAMLPDGRHLVVRSYGLAGVYTYPGLRRLGGFDLPRQRQGEGISVGPGGRIRLSSEGVRSPVRQVSVPAALARRMRPAAAPTATPASPSATQSASQSASPSASAAPSPTAAPSPVVDHDRKDAAGPREGWLTWTVPGVLVLGAVGIGVGLRRRSE